MADMFSYFMGKDGFHWFIGVCEDRDDPDTLGRVRCRVFGYHTDDLTKLPTQDLPWANVVLPPNAKPGEIPNITPGQWVFGFWRDPDYHQEPIILGILPGRPAETPNPNKGFNDPNSPNAPTSQSTQYRDAPDFGPYPLRTGEPDTNRLISNDATRVHPLVENVRAAEVAEVGTIPASTGNDFTEPEYPYAPRYPYNHVYESESGHVIEIDDTPKNERIHERHTSGTYYEIDAGGNKTTKVVGDKFDVTIGSNHVYVKGDVNLTIDSNCNTFIKGNYHLQVEENMVVQVGGTLTENVKGDVLEQYESNKTENVKKAVVEIYEDTKTESVTKKVTETFGEGQQTSITGEYDLDSTGAMSIESDSTIKINSPGETQNAARLGDKADEGDDPPGISGTDGTNKIEEGSATVFIGDNGSTSLATPAVAPEIDLDPVTTVRTATGVSSNINVTPEKAREVIRGRSVELANGIDPDLNEPFESGSSTTPAPLPSAADGNDFPSASEEETNLVDDADFDGQLLRFLPHTDDRISPTLRGIMEEVAKEYGQTLVITSAYRSAAYNASVGGAKKSQHQQGNAVDVRMTNTSVADRQRFLRIAASKGIQGFGCYFPASSGGNFIHCDIGGKRQWGPNGSRTGSYGWQRQTLSGLGWST